MWDSVGYNLSYVLESHNWRFIFIWITGLYFPDFLLDSWYILFLTPLKIIGDKRFQFEIYIRLKLGIIIRHNHVQKYLACIKNAFLVLSIRIHYVL